ncbi:MAG: AraC family transcriptional regulator [Acidobacteriaceae bacterium]
MIRQNDCGSCRAHQGCFGAEGLVLYLQYRPKRLQPWVRSLWYVRAPDATPGRERVLPTGNTQIVINLARDFCVGCGEGEGSFKQAAALLAGVQRRYSVVDAADFAEMMGVVFAPGGLRRFVAVPAAEFRFAETPLEAVWGGGAEELRERLMGAVGVREKFRVLELELLRRMRGSEQHAAVGHALWRLGCGTSAARVREIAVETGYSARRLQQLFEEEVGVGPKLFARIVRFQQAVQCLHRGCEVRWDELALDCGFSDQAHLSNEFRAFSGMSPTQYAREARVWANHVKE